MATVTHVDGRWHGEMVKLDIERQVTSFAREHGGCTERCPFEEEIRQTGDVFVYQHKPITEPFRWGPFVNPRA